MTDIFILHIFFLLKSIYSLSLIYFLFPLLLSNPIQFTISLSIFNHLLCWLLAAKTKTKTMTFDFIKLFVFILISTWGLVVIGGGDLISLKGIALGSLLSSTTFNCLHHLLLSNLELSKLIGFVFNLNFLALFQKNPLILSLILSSIGSLIGALMAGLVVVLDWNATWQVFPIPNVIACILGESCGLVFSLILFCMFRIINKLK